jgi:DNA-binding CsgD family transcriptional regulator
MTITAGHPTQPSNPAHPGTRPSALVEAEWARDVRVFQVLSGQLATEVDPALLDGVVRRLLIGLRPHLAHALPKRRGGVLVLTVRERQCLELIAEGRTNVRIGSALGVTEDTVKTHLRRLFKALGARDRAHAVALGYQRGLLGGTA